MILRGNPYSFQNCLMIALNKGEKGIAILAPCLYRNKETVDDTGERKTVVKGVRGIRTFQSGGGIVSVILFVGGFFLYVRNRKPLP